MKDISLILYTLLNNCLDLLPEKDDEDDELHEEGHDEGIESICLSIV